MQTTPNVYNVVINYLRCMSLISGCNHLREPVRAVCSIYKPNAYGAEVDESLMMNGIFHVHSQGDLYLIFFGECSLTS